MNDFWEKSKLKETYEYNEDKALTEKIVENLSDDLLKKEYLKKEDRNRYTGHCYVVSETLYHLTKEEFFVYNIKHEDSSHWFLKDKSGCVVDLTREQFKTIVPYEKAKRRFFLTKQPSKRSKILIDRIGDNNG